MILPGDLIEVEDYSQVDRFDDEREHIGQFELGRPDCQWVDVWVRNEGLEVRDYSGQLVLLTDDEEARAEAWAT